MEDHQFARRRGTEKPNPRRNSETYKVPFQNLRQIPASKWVRRDKTKGSQKPLNTPAILRQSKPQRPLVPGISFYRFRRFIRSYVHGKPRIHLAQRRRDLPCPRRQHWICWHRNIQRHFVHDSIIDPQRRTVFHITPICAHCLITPWKHPRQNPRLHGIRGS